MRSKITAQGLAREFGIRSKIYLDTINQLLPLWRMIKPSNPPSFESWLSHYKLVYGQQVDEELFVIHSYLATVVKLVIFFRLEGSVDIQENELNRIIRGDYFSSFGIENFVNNDFSTWVLDEIVVKECSQLFCRLANHLARYDFSGITEDFFKELYEELIQRDVRHEIGEYYTPEWLTQLTLLEVQRVWKEKHSGIPRILDPACGSGTFLYNAISLLRRETNRDISLEEIIENVVGIEVNPLASLLAKANYLTALGDLVEKGCRVKLPIYTADALSFSLCDFDVLVGNPPWIVLRSIKNAVYQDRLKQEILKYKLLGKGEVHLFTQMEMASLFFTKCSDIYLRVGGVIGFVMPRSVIAGTIQHINFRRFENPKLGLVKILDFEGVQPLFNMPSCVLIAIKGQKTEYPVLAERYSGKLPSRNAGLNKVKGFLSTSSYEYSPPEFPTQRSIYYNKFRVGASIFPRSLYFIHLVSRVGNQVLVRTSKEILRMVKPPWSVQLEAEIEPEFIYCTLLAWELIPFGYIRLRPITLPIEPFHNGYRILDYVSLRNSGYLGSAKWWEQAEKVWRERRTEKSSTRFPRLTDRLDYNNLLTSQDAEKRYVVLYGATGSNIFSCVIDRTALSKFTSAQVEVKPRTFVADVKTWLHATDDKMEAHYLSAIFNSEALNVMIKPLQPRGLGGPRAIHRRPLLFPIPEFSQEQSQHTRLAQIGIQCHQRVKQILPIKSTKARRTVKNQLRNEIREINTIVKDIVS